MKAGPHDPSDLLGFKQEVSEKLPQGGSWVLGEAIMHTSTEARMGMRAALTGFAVLMLLQSCEYPPPLPPGGGLSRKEYSSFLLWLTGLGNTCSAKVMGICILLWFPLPFT